ncbi:hypothetical protein CWE15_00705 [Aliidiomarina taiwanensis]|uniref:Uncharacterized protein n=1 Tax=Aliidiomarina taiwanensis TaxID=946228 RepID=A0A432X8P3_9GAMM|nr:hypothetical protein [Aliidiomarina taiwanensis]RUO43757.1 hypothetical protein CWE15_00705 [Aliidiomarina taiwanensis]
MRTPTTQETKKDIQIKGAQAEVYFEHAGREIIFKFSLYSGKERVFVNGELVSEARNWRFKSTHYFTYQGTRYQLQIAMKRSLTGLLVGQSTIELEADGVLVDSDEFNYLKNSGPFSWKKFFLSLLPYFIIGAVVGFCVSFFSIKLFS